MCGIFKAVKTGVSLCNDEYHNKANPRSALLAFMNKNSLPTDLKRVREIIKDIDLCMLTTVGDSGAPHTRPMSNNRDVEFDGDLWFFTYGNTHKSLEIRENNKVSVAFSAPEDNVYLVMLGEAQLIRDKNKIKELWRPILKAWFPQGLEEPDLALIKVNAISAELWEGPTNFFSQAWHLAKALATGKQFEGEHRTVSLG